MPTSYNRYFSSRGLEPVYRAEDAEEISIKLSNSVTYPKGTVLGEIVGVDEVQTITITGTPTGGTFTVSYGGSTSAAIAYNATAATVQTALLAMASITSNTIQTLTASGTPTGGVFTVSYSGSTSAPIAWNATAATIQAALEAMPSIGSGNVTCTGGPISTTPVVCTFGGVLAGVPIPLLSVSTMFLLPTTAAITPTITAVGGGGGENVACAGGPFPGTAVTVTFKNRLGKTNVAAMTTTDSFTGGTSPASAVTTTTAGVAGTGLFKKCDKTATDGSQTAKALLKFDCAVDASGNITLGAATGGDPNGATYLTVPAYVSGFFNTLDVPNLSDAMVADLGALIQGSLGAATGGVLRVGGN